MLIEITEEEQAFHLYQSRLDKQREQLTNDNYLAELKRDNTQITEAYERERERAEQERERAEQERERAERTEQMLEQERREKEALFAQLKALKSGKNGN